MVGTKKCEYMGLTPLLTWAIAFGPLGAFFRDLKQEAQS